APPWRWRQGVSRPDLSCTRLRVPVVADLDSKVIASPGSSRAGALPAELTPRLPIVERRKQGGRRAVRSLALDDRAHRSGRRAEVTAQATSLLELRALPAPS